MNLKFNNISIIFMDGDSRTFTGTTRALVSGDSLHIYCQDGELAPEVHMGSYPIINIKEWKSTPTYGY